MPKQSCHRVAFVVIFRMVTLAVVLEAGGGSFFDPLVAVEVEELEDPSETRRIVVVEDAAGILYDAAAAAALAATANGFWSK